MKYTIKGKEYKLRNYEVTFAKSIVAKFIKEIRHKYSQFGTYRGYITFLIVMLVMSQDCLEQMGPEEYDEIFTDSKNKDS